MKPLRVAFCHYASDVGGGSDRSLLDTVMALPRERVEPVLFLKPGDPLAERYREAGMTVVELAMTPPRRALDAAKLARFLLDYGPSVLRLRAALRESRADVVHVNTLFNIQAPVAARLAGLPLVWHVREYIPDSRVYGALCAMARTLSTRIIAISGLVAETLGPCGGRMRKVLNSTDLGAFASPSDGHALRQELGIAPGQPVVTVAGRLEHWKGQHVFVETVPAILEACPEAVFLIVGGAAVNKPEYGPMLQERCEALGITGRVRFTGRREDMPAVLAATDILVLPTVTPEPFGLTVVEAMAAARPVVATAAGGPLDTVVDGETGLHIRPDDPADLAAKVTALLQDPARARAMGQAGRRRAFEHFSIAREAREVLAVLEEAADPGATRRPSCR